MKDIVRSPRFLWLSAFLGAFAAYAASCAPGIAPYRDAGEMASVLATLGVAHPPGYPVYTLLGHVFTSVPFGSMVYRTNVFSALAAAGALMLFFRVLREWVSPAPAFFAAALFGLSHIFWELSAVTEMYSLGIFWLALQMWAAVVRRDPVLWAFVAATGLGVRMDMLLLIPVFLFWFRRNDIALDWKLIAIAFTLGASAYLYLPIRSLQDPLIDWANPDTLLGAFNAARRKNYGGTLDLLSLSYRTGENFLSGLLVYGRHLISGFGWIGTAAIIWGVLRGRRVASPGYTLALWIFLVACPFYLFLANMPPNPHSLSVVEAAFPVPDLMLAIIAALGVQNLWERRHGVKILAIAAAAVALVNVPAGAHRGWKRSNFYAEDYVNNVWRCAPRGAVVVFHKDVQLFSLWESQIVRRRRPDVSLISIGLSASPWYWQMARRWETAAAPEVSLKDPRGWAALRSGLGDRPLLAGYETEIPDAGLHLSAQGLTMRIDATAAPYEPVRERLLSELGVFRGRDRYGETPDFFSTDLIGDHARAYHRAGFDAMMKNRVREAAWLFRRSETLDPTFPRPPADRGFMLFNAGDMPGAYEAYRTAVVRYQEMLRLSGRYKALPDVVQSIRMDLANAYTNLGAVEERLGHRDAARGSYVSSISLHPTAQAHYNLAVTHWGTDWDQATSLLREAIRLDPNFVPARRELAAANYQRRLEGR